VDNASLEWKDIAELAVRIDGKPYFVDGTPLIPMVMLMPMMVLCRYQKSNRGW
jgi:hypothetical protein